MKFHDKIIIFGIILFGLCLFFSQGLRADDFDLPAIRNTRLGIVYTNFDTAALVAQSGDTFELGVYSDTNGWKNTNDKNILLSYLFPYIQTEEKIESDSSIIKYFYYNNSNKQIFLFQKEIYIKANDGHWYLYEFTINGEKK
jgi:hypothetical protein